MILKGESAEEFNRKADENYEKFKARQKQNIIDMMDADEKLGLYEKPTKLYTIEDIERCVEHWGLCKVEREHIEKFLETKTKKMKASELRIGNYFQWIKIASMGIGKDVITKDNHYTYENFKEPIPLTEEWLKRLGFEIKKGAWGTSAEIRIGRVRYVLYQNGNVWSINPTDVFRVDFKYIHTVQNHYFALTGQELNQNN